MFVKTLISNYCSNDRVGNYNTLLSNKIVKFLNKIYKLNLINLNLLEDKYRNYSWYIDKSSGKFYNILVSINNLYIQNIFKSNDDILNNLKTKEYFEICVDINKLSRNNFLNSDSIFKFSLDNFNQREHYSIVDFDSKNIKFNKLKRRKLNINYIKRKRSKSEEKNIWFDMVSASRVRNYLLNDPLLDWLNEYNITSIYDVPKYRVSNTVGVVSYNNKDEFTKHIMDQGIIFENEVYKILKNKFNIVKVAESYDSRSLEKFKKTIKLMKDGIDILYQPILQDFKNKIYGSPDLLIRSDKINDIFGYEVIDEKDKYIKSPKLNTNFHYLVVDIKHSTLYLNSDGITLRNEKSIPAYKGQIYVYNMALGNVQGYQPNKGFILGKKYIFKKSNVLCSGNNFMEKLGVIDYQGRDYNYINQTKNALNWIRNVRTNGNKWALLPVPSRRELFPNMKNEKDGSWKKIKSDLDKKINEITSIWMCGIKKRNIAHDKYIYSWKDKRCTSKNLEFKEGKTSQILDKILNINRQNKKLIDVGSLLKNNNWRKNSDLFEFYIDYETMNSNFGECKINNNNIGYVDNEFIFLIGVGFIKDGSWIFKDFLCEKKNKESEVKMIKSFWKYINNILEKSKKKKSVFYHWTHAEPINYRKLLERHSLKLPEKNFYDLYSLFKNNKIVIKGALNYSLKSIAKAMMNNNLIKTSWDENNPCSNGLKAMLLAYKIYQKNIYVDKSEPIINDIIHYNEVDCKVLWEILSYLRNNY